MPQAGGKNAPNGRRYPFLNGSKAIFAHTKNNACPEKIPFLSGSKARKKQLNPLALEGV